MANAIAPHRRRESVLKANTYGICDDASLAPFFRCHPVHRGEDPVPRRHLKPAPDHLQLDKLTPIHVKECLKQKIADRMKPRGAFVISPVTLRTALIRTVKWDLISRNAAALVRGPRVERYDIRPLTPDEARVFKFGRPNPYLVASRRTPHSAARRRGRALECQAEGSV